MMALASTGAMSAQYCSFQLPSVIAVSCQNIYVTNDRYPTLTIAPNVTLDGSAQLPFTNAAAVFF